MGKMRQYMELVRDIWPDATDEQCHRALHAAGIGLIGMYDANGADRVGVLLDLFYRKSIDGTIASAIKVTEQENNALAEQIARMFANQDHESF